MPPTKRTEAAAILPDLDQLDEVRLPRLQGLIAQGGIFAPVPEGGRR